MRVLGRVGARDAELVVLLVDGVEALGVENAVAKVKVRLDRQEPERKLQQHRVPRRQRARHRRAKVLEGCAHAIQLRAAASARARRRSPGYTM